MVRIYTPPVAANAPFITTAADSGLSAETVLGDGVNMAGTFAARPAASLAGRTYFATDTGLFYRDSGTAWALTGHAQIHAIDGADHTGTIAHSALSGVTADGHHKRTEAKNSAGSTAGETVTWTTAFSSVPVVVGMVLRNGGDTATMTIRANSRSTTAAEVHSQAGGGDYSAVKMVIAQEAT